MIYKIGERRLEQRGDGHWIADNATVIGSVIMEANSSIWFRSEEHTSELQSPR